MLLIRIPLIDIGETSVHHKNRYYLGPKHYQTSTILHIITVYLLRFIYDKAR